MAYGLCVDPRIVRPINRNASETPLLESTCISAVSCPRTFTQVTMCNTALLSALLNEAIDLHFPRLLGTIVATLRKDELDARAFANIGLTSKISSLSVRSVAR